MIPKLLDLFCCSGGAGMGYARAGFAVTGVDNRPQPNYPYPFVQGDAIEYLREHGGEFDAIHASPPCQGYSRHVSSESSQWAGTKGKDEARLIATVRGLLDALGKPYIIENVAGAREEMRSPLVLCGTMFGLPIPRHRLFESNIPLTAPEHPKCRGVAKQYAAEQGWDYRDMTVTGKGRRAGTTLRWKEIMGWPLGHAATQHELREAIPPAYTEHLGQQLFAAAKASLTAGLSHIQPGA